MLLEAQVRLAGETVWIGPDCSKKTLYLPLDIVIPRGVGYAQRRSLVLLGLHVLLPTLGLGCINLSRNPELRRRPSPFWVLLRVAIFAEKGGS